MRIRINESGLDLAEDDVEGFIYDLNIAAYGEPTTTAIETISQAEGISINKEGDNIIANADGKIILMQLYTTEGALVDKAENNSIYVGYLNAGVYIVKVYTADREKSAKFLLRK